MPFPYCFSLGAPDAIPVMIGQHESMAERLKLMFSAFVTSIVCNPLNNVQTRGLKV